MAGPKKYTPISCNFYDELEARATLRRPCLIRYQDDAGVGAEKTGLIADLYAREGIEYLKLTDGFTLRLDRLISVDGKKLEGYC